MPCIWRWKRQSPNSRTDALRSARNPPLRAALRVRLLPSPRDGLLEERNRHGIGRFRTAHGNDDRVRSRDGASIPAAQLGFDEALGPDVGDLSEPRRAAVRLVVLGRIDLDQNTPLAGDCRPVAAPA